MRTTQKTCLLHSFIILFLSNNTKANGLFSLDIFSTQCNAFHLRTICDNSDHTVDFVCTEYFPEMSVFRPGVPSFISLLSTSLHSTAVKETWCPYLLDRREWQIHLLSHIHPMKSPLNSYMEIVTLVMLEAQINVNLDHHPSQTNSYSHSSLITGPCRTSRALPIKSINLLLNLIFLSFWTQV